MTRGVDHIRAETYHGRQASVRNAFRYSVDYLLMDAERDAKAPLFFSRNRANLFSLRDQDHGGRPDEGRGAEWARQVFRRYKVDPARIELLAQPRVLGHVFNPVSFWLARDEDERLIAVIAEVTNTFGDRHSYFVANDDGIPIRPGDTLEATKVFHVSPFQPVEGTYQFRFDISDRNVNVWIRYDSSKGTLIATLGGARERLTNLSILKSLVRRPFGSRRVVALIHWQALKLFFKGARYRSRPAAPSSEVS